MLAHYCLQLYSSSSFCFGQPLNQPHNQVATLLLSLPYEVCIYTVLIPDKNSNYRTDGLLSVLHRIETSVIVCPASHKSKGVCMVAEPASIQQPR